MTSKSPVGDKSVVTDKLPSHPPIYVIILYIYIYILCIYIYILCSLDNIYIYIYVLCMYIYIYIYILCVCIYIYIYIYPLVSTEVTFGRGDLSVCPLGVFTRAYSLLCLYRIFYILPTCIIILYSNSIINSIMSVLFLLGGLCPRGPHRNKHSKQNKYIYIYIYIYMHAYINKSINIDIYMYRCVYIYIYIYKGTSPYGHFCASLMCHSCSELPAACYSVGRLPVCSGGTCVAWELQGEGSSTSSVFSQTPVCHGL